MGQFLNNSTHYELIFITKMERRIGEIFEYQGKILRVKEAEGKICEGCSFLNKCTCETKGTVGWCDCGTRSDKKNVIFVEVKDQSHKESETVKERKIGDVFDYEGKKLRVEEFRSDCVGCFFDGQCSKTIKETTGACGSSIREDGKNVIFVEDKNDYREQPHEKPQKLNLCEILKDCPKGTEFWSPMLGNVKLNSIDHVQQRVFVILETGANWYINSDATITLDYVTSAEIMLYPSREQRDWSKVKYEPKKKLPRTWVEFCASHDITMSEYYIGETGKIFNSNTGKRIPDRKKTLLPSEEAAEAHLAYMQLHQLRDVWREGWLPDWKDDMQSKFSIVYNNGEYSVFDYQYVSRFLSFQDRNRAKEFLECFKGLIKKAGDLI